jgi:nanoRNase/pAp phosphatase (c-di-AMP/oligoRNAs hydrolase)
MKVITTHFNADFDAFPRWWPPEAVSDACSSSRSKRRRSRLPHGRPLLSQHSEAQGIDYDEVDTLIVVDTRQKAGSGAARLIDEKHVKVHVYDTPRHPRTTSRATHDDGKSGRASPCS